MSVQRVRLAENHAAIAELATRHGALNIRVFGSVATDKATEGSDIDLIVDMLPGRTLFDLGALLMDLRELLGCDVDLVTTGSLSGEFGRRVLADAVPLDELVA